jgi:putative inorganic carbon (hco3(-)) transporter
VDHGPVIAFALVNGPLPKAGVIVAAALVVGAVLLRIRRLRALTMLALVVLTPVLLLADLWNSPHLHIVHRHPLEAVVGGVLILAALVAAASVIARRPWLVAPLVVLTLPFRIPITTGGTTSNLLLPLYVVLAVGTLACIGSAFGIWSPRTPAGRAGSGTARPDRSRHGESSSTDPAPLRSARVRAATWMERLLVVYVLLYAIQATYSLDFQLALQQVVFFYVPFSLGYCLLRELEWDARMVRTCLLVAVGVALAFSGVAFVEYATRKLFLNHKLIATNADHTYFAVNSVFYDSNIFGRFLALVMVLLAVALLYRRSPREQLSSAGGLAIMWVALVLSLSRSSLGALLAGLIILAAVRWRVSRAVVAGVVVVAAGAGALAISPHTFGLEQGTNGVFAGRGSLVTGGLDMFGQRPVWGYGSGSFQNEYLRQHRPCTAFRTTHCSPGGVGDSHTLPVTIAAEQGVIGELPYLGLLLAALITLFHGARVDPARAAVGAAFVALILHTLVYDDFLSDPITWTLLAAGVALARTSRPTTEPETVPALGAQPLAA